MKYSLVLFLSFITVSLIARDPIAPYRLGSPTNQNPGKIIISAHRGASGYEPENTMRAFAKAIQMGAPMIELDVHLAKTGEIVVIHDFYTKDNKKVVDLTLDQLKAYDLGKGERIPLLADVLALVNQRAITNIELKAEGTPKPVADLLKQLIKDKKGKPSDFIISSFDHFLVQEFHKYLPSVPTAVLLEGNPIRRAQIATDADAQTAILQYKWVTPEFIKDAHARNVTVMAYTVNDIETAQKLQKMGVDGIITNYPDLLTKLF